MSETGETAVKLEGLPVRLVLAGAVLLAICTAAGVANKAEFFRSYLIAFLFWIGITLGSLALLMVQHLTGGRWALVIRRILEAGSRTLPLMAVAALPLLAGMKTIYSWSRPGQTDPDILSKRFIRGIEADATEARMWYERARDLGSPEGPRRIETLLAQKLR